MQRLLPFGSVSTGTYQKIHRGQIAATTPVHIDTHPLMFYTFSWFRYYVAKSSKNNFVPKYDKTRTAKATWVDKTMSFPLQPKTMWPNKMTANPIQAMTDKIVL